MTADPKKRWPRAEALEVARELCVRLKPRCEKLIVAGSLRRRKQEVGDVEIVFVPRMEARQVDLFGSADFNLADEEIDRMAEDGTIAKRLSRVGITTWGEKNKLALHRSGIAVDLFSAKPEAWWNYIVCRTGPASLNERIATEAKRRGYRWNPYGAGFTRLADGAEIPMESERSVFAFVGMPYLEPWERDR